LSDTPFYVGNYVVSDSKKEFRIPYEELIEGVTRSALQGEWLTFLTRLTVRTSDGKTYSAEKANCTSEVKDLL
jgi:hypothetical protein